MSSPSISRRRLLQCAGSALVLLAALPPTRVEATLTCGTRNWRFCSKCHSMFHRGDGIGVCTDGQGHVAQGYNFDLPCNRNETPTAQKNWRQCKHCNVMFFNGYRNKGRCPANGRGHAAETVDYVLPHDIPGTSTRQTQWRFCHRCHAMFYDGYVAKGSCPAGGGHVAQGYGFVLPHARPT